MSIRELDPDLAVEDDVEGIAGIAARTMVSPGPNRFARAGIRRRCRADIPANSGSIFSTGSQSSPTRSGRRRAGKTSGARASDSTVVMCRA
jgi:hypothetical protein